MSVGGWEGKGGGGTKVKGHEWELAVSLCLSLLNALEFATVMHGRIKGTTRLYRPCSLWSGIYYYIWHSYYAPWLFRHKFSQLQLGHEIMPLA